MATGQGDEGRWGAAVVSGSKDSKAFKMGQRCYRMIHATVGDSQHASLNQDAARAGAREAWSKPADRDDFVAGWMLERVGHQIERAGAPRVYMPPWPKLGFGDE